MTARPRPLRRRRLATTTLVALAALLGTQPSFARIAQNTVDAVATLGAKGRVIKVTGPLEVTAGEVVFLRVTLTQRTTGAVAEGYSYLVGTGAAQQWSVRALTLSLDSFEEGPAIAVAIARSSDRAEGTDAHQWLVNVTLVRE